MLGKHLRNRKDFLKNIGILHRKRLIQNNMVEPNSRHLRNSFCPRFRRFHHDTVPVKIHVTPHVFDVARHRLFINTNRDAVRRIDPDTHRFDKRNVPDFLIPIF